MPAGRRVPRAGRAGAAQCRAGAGADPRSSRGRTVLEGSRARRCGGPVGWRRRGGRWGGVGRGGHGVESSTTPCSTEPPAGPARPGRSDPAPRNVGLGLLDLPGIAVGDHVTDPAQVRKTVANPARIPTSQARRGGQHLIDRPDRRRQQLGRLRACPGTRNHSRGGERDHPGHTARRGPGGSQGDGSAGGDQAHRDSSVVASGGVSGPGPPPAAVSVAAAGRCR